MKKLFLLGILTKQKQLRVVDPGLPYTLLWPNPGSSVKLRACALASGVPRGESSHHHSSSFPCLHIQASRRPTYLNHLPFSGKVYRIASQLQEAA